MVWQKAEKNGPTGSAWQSTPWSNPVAVRVRLRGGSAPCWASGSPGPGSNGPAGCPQSVPGAARHTAGWPAPQYRCMVSPNRSVVDQALGAAVGRDDARQVAAVHHAALDGVGWSPRAGAGSRQAPVPARRWPCVDARRRVAGGLVEQRHRQLAPMRAVDVVDALAQSHPPPPAGAVSRRTRWPSAVRANPRARAGTAPGPGAFPGPSRGG